MTPEDALNLLKKSESRDIVDASSKLKDSMDLKKKSKQVSNLTGDSTNVIEINQTTDLSKEV